MTIATVQLMSQTLWREVTYTALLPDPAVVGSGPYPVLYHLHGGNQNHTAWLYNSYLRRATQALPFIVILPDGAQSRWANGGTPFTAYEDFLIEELAQHVRHTFPATRGKWAIGGNSMGGFGAVRLGLKYPQRFCSIWSHSGVFPTADTLPEHWYWSGNPADLDCYALVDQLTPQLLPQLSFDCGIEDHLLDHNRRWHAFLETRGIQHTYHEHPGGHNWDYWDTHVQAALMEHRVMPSNNCNARFTHWMLKSLYAAPAPHECPLGWQAVVSVHALLSVIQCGMLSATSGHRAKGFSMAFHTGQSYCQHAICIGTPEVQKLLLAPKARDVEDAVSFYLHAAPARPDIHYFCIYQHDRPVGQIMLHDINARSGESLIGYHLFRAADRSQGIGTVALALLQAYVQTETSLTQLIIITSHDNLASQHIATKCGFHVRGPAREDPERLIVFAWEVPHP